MAGLLFVFPLPKQRVAATAGKKHNILVLPVTLRKLLTAKPGCGGDAPTLKLVARFGVKGDLPQERLAGIVVGILLPFSAKQEVIFSLAHAVNFLLSCRLPFSLLTLIYPLTQFH